MKGKQTSFYSVLNSWRHFITQIKLLNFLKQKLFPLWKINDFIPKMEYNIGMKKIQMVPLSKMEEMSKYQKLWNYIKNCGNDEIIISFEDVKNICGFEIDHSFLQHKKELKNFGYEVKKISLKNKTLQFIKFD